MAPLQNLTTAGCEAVVLGFVTCHTGDTSGRCLVTATPDLDEAN